MKARKTKRVKRRPQLLAPRLALVVGAHPDDAEYGCGGTITKWVKAGTEVHYAIATDGGAGDSFGAYCSDELARLRREEQLAAAATLGVRPENVSFLGYADSSVEYSAELRGKIVYLLRKLRPEVVLTHECGPRVRFDADGINHHDHRQLGLAVMDAFYPYSRVVHQRLEQNLPAYQAPHLLTWDVCEPNYWEDVTDTAEQKLAALACHKSQTHQSLLRWYDSLMSEMGAESGFAKAEAFYRFTLA